MDAGIIQSSYHQQEPAPTIVEQCYNINIMKKFKITF